MNVDRMRKVNMATIDALYPVRWITGLPDGEIPDFPAGRMWTLPDADVAFERRPKRTNRWSMRRAEDA